MQWEALFHIFPAIIHNSLKTEQRQSGKLGPEKSVNENVRSRQEFDIDCRVQQDVNLYGDFWQDVHAPNLSS
jgi:hypothetical protein